MDLLEKGNSVKRHPWELARFEVVKDISKIYLEKNKGNILDLGCGDLFFIEKFKNFQPNSSCYAVDIAFTEEFIETHKNTTIKIFNSIKDLPDDLTFNIVFLMDVLEHIEDDETFLEDFVNSKYVNHETIFIITVPAYQKLFFSHDTFLKHFRRYTNTSLITLIEQCGLNAIEKGYFFLSLLAPRFLSVQKERITGTARFKNGTDVGNWNANPFLTKLIKQILIADYKIQKGLKKAGLRLPGLSNYIVCKKPV